MYLTLNTHSMRSRSSCLRLLLKVHALLLAVGFLLPLFANEAAVIDKPLPPADAARRVTMPAGFQMTMFAAEPDIPPRCR